MPAPDAAPVGTILLCTVGGSPEPIVKAIESRRPDRVVFLATVDNPEADPPWRGSAPELPALAERCGLGAEGDRWTVTAVVPDDPDRIFAEAVDLLRRLRRDHPRARIVADFTGGTKSMSAGLLQAALQVGGIEAQLMSGRRDDTSRVVPGSERPFPLRFDAVFAEQALARAELFWRDAAYAEAEILLRAQHDQLQAAEGLPEALTRRLARALHASAMLAAWDRFEHRRALALLQDHGLAQRWTDIARLREPLQRLVREDRRMPLLLLDLWRNARRRAARGQYDDAVARAYRLVEATAQHLHGLETGLDTGAVDLQRIPEALRAKWAQELGPRRQAGLVKAWMLFLELRPDHPVSHALATPFEGRKPLDLLQGWIGRRNGSLLAHGFEPVGEAGWREVEPWLERIWCGKIWPAIAGGLDLPPFPTSLSGLTEAL